MAYGKYICSRCDREFKGHKKNWFDDELCPSCLKKTVLELDKERHRLDELFEDDEIQDDITMQSKWKW